MKLLSDIPRRVLCCAVALSVTWALLGAVSDPVAHAELRCRALTSGAFEFTSIVAHESNRGRVVRCSTARAVLRRFGKKAKYPGPCSDRLLEKGCSVKGWGCGIQVRPTTRGHCLYPGGALIGFMWRQVHDPH